MHTRIYVRAEEMDVEDILLLGWQVFKRQLKIVAPVAWGIGVPLNIVLMRFPGIISVAVGLTGWLLTLICISHVVERDLNEEVVNVREIFGIGFKKILPMLGTFVAKYLTVLVYSVFLVVPGVYWFFNYFFVTMAVSLRGLHGKRALAYSRSMVKRNRWKVAVRGMWLWTFYLPFWFVPDAFLFLVTLGRFQGHVWFSYPGIFISVLFNAYFMIILTIFFLHNDYLCHTGKAATAPVSLINESKSAEVVMAI